MTKKIAETFYFYDYETFGKSPSMDRPAQFAGVRTDKNFNIIDKPLVIYCAPADDYLPEPEAVILTGITPQEACKKGVNEAEFARKIHQAFCSQCTCILGYNNIRFDDEVSRNIFYRSFYDPYSYSWQNGNSRWDLLDVMRACYALSPSGIVWPKNEKGFPSFRLEHLTRANEIEHTDAHDAISDVYATISMAKKAKQSQPRLFNFLLKYRYKNKLNTLINISEMTPLVHISSIFGSVRRNTGWIVPLARHPTNKNAIIICDLSGDLTELLSLNAERLHDWMYARKDSLAANQKPLPVKLVHINRCPVLLPAKTLLPENAKRLGIDRQTCLKNLQLLRQYPKVREKVASLFTQSAPYRSSDDVDTRIYDGFFSDADKVAMKIIQQTQPKNLPALKLKFNDCRMKELLFRYRARNYPNTLDSSEQKIWLQHRKKVLSAEQVKNYLLKIEELFKIYEGNKEKISILKALSDYSKKLAC